MARNIMFPHRLVSRSTFLFFLPWLHISRWESGAFFSLSWSDKENDLLHTLWALMWGAIFPVWTVRGGAEINHCLAELKQKSTFERIIPPSRGIVCHNKEGESLNLNGSTWKKVIPSKGNVPMVYFFPLCVDRSFVVLVNAIVELGLLWRNPDANHACRPPKSIWSPLFVWFFFSERAIVCLACSRDSVGSFLKLNDANREGK